MATNDILLKTQRNAVLESIQKAGLNPTEFTWTRQGGVQGQLPYLRLEHAASECYFDFWIYAGLGIVGRWAPGSSMPVEISTPNHWPYIAALVAAWLRNLRREHEAPDLWAEVAKVKELASVANAEEPDRPFTQEERVRIAERLDEIHAFLVSTQRLEASQDVYVRDRLDYLKEASTRQTREAWALMFLGVIMSFLLSSIVPPDAVQEYLRTVALHFSGPRGFLPRK